MRYNRKYSLIAQLLKEEFVQQMLPGMDDFLDAEVISPENITPEDVTEETLDNPIPNAEQLTFRDLGSSITRKYLNKYPTADDVDPDNTVPRSGTKKDTDPFVKLLKIYLIDNGLSSSAHAHNNAKAIRSITQDGEVASKNTTNFDMEVSLQKLRDPTSREQKVVAARARLGISVLQDDFFGTVTSELTAPTSQPSISGQHFGFTWRNKHYGLPRSAEGEYDLSNPTKEYEKNFLAAIAAIKLVSNTNNSEPGVPGESMVLTQLGWMDTNVDGTSTFADASDGEFGPNSNALYSVKTTFSADDAYTNTPVTFKSMQSLFIEMFRVSKGGSYATVSGEERNQIMNEPGFDSFSLNLGTVAIRWKGNKITCIITGPVVIRGSEVKITFEKRRDYELNSRAKVKAMLGGLSGTEPQETFAFEITLPNDIIQNLDDYAAPVLNSDAYDPSMINFDESFKQALPKLFEWAVK